MIIEDFESQQSSKQEIIELSENKNNSEFNLENLELNELSDQTKKPTKIEYQCPISLQISKIIENKIHKKSKFFLENSFIYSNPFIIFFEQ